MDDFVKVELLPPDGKWWVNVSDWTLCINQDTVPDWFKDDKLEFERKFQKEVELFIKKNTIKNQEIQSLGDGFYFLVNCKVKTLLNGAVVMLKHTTVENMISNSYVMQMDDSSLIKKTGTIYIAKESGFKTNYTL